MSDWFAQAPHGVRFDWGLSPAVLRRAPFTPRLAVPSPNGSAIAAATATPSSPTDIFAASLRNVTATSRWLVGHGQGTPDHPVSVIAAGERWPDGSLRPALEDLLGAGAVIAALARAGAGPLSPEAAAARGWSLTRYRRRPNRRRRLSAGVPAGIVGGPLTADHVPDDRRDELIIDRFT
jgi:phosphosulfolactate phosphohydrolase-like enzyme